MSSATMALLKTASARRRPASSSASSHSVNTISSHFPIISKPATTLGKQIKVPGSHWEGRLTEEKTRCTCAPSSTSLPCTPSSACAKSAAFKLETLPRLPQHLPQRLPRCPPPGLPHHAAHRAASSSTFRPLDPSQVLEPPPLDPGS